MPMRYIPIEARKVPSCKGDWAAIQQASKHHMTQEKERG